MRKKITKCLRGILAAIVAISVVSFVGVENVQASDSGIVTNKTAVYNEKTDDYTVTLEAYATGEITVETKAQALDVIFVNDQSGSMGWGFGPNNIVKPGESTRMEVLVKSTLNFLDVLHENAVSNKVEHRVGVVGFSRNEHVDVFNNGNYLNDQAYYRAFQSVFEKDGIKKSLEQLRPYGDTYIVRGVEAAAKIYEANKTDNQRVVILFTDGQASGRRKETIDYAHELKNKYNAIVYTVSALPELTDDEKIKTETFLSYMSSNYPDAKAITEFDYDPGDQVSDKFTKTATSAAELEAVFKEISEEVTKPSTTVENAVLIDTMSEYFMTPTLSDVKVYTQDYNDDSKDITSEGAWINKTDVTNTSDIKVGVDETSKQVSVRGFDYAKYFVPIINTAPESTHVGKKLVVQFTTKKRPGFIGGNNVPTNAVNSGIYSGSTVVESFEVPKVNVPLDIKAIANDSYVYVTQGINTPMNIIDADLGLSGVGFQYYDRNNQMYTLVKDTSGYIANAFSDLLYTFKDSSGAVIATYTLTAGQMINNEVIQNLFKHKSYLENEKISVELQASASAASLITNQQGVTPLTSKANANVYVFKPTITVNNDIVFLGDTYKLTDVVDRVVWTCSDHNVTAKPSEAAPTLSYTFYENNKLVDAAELFKPKQTTTLTVKTAIGNKDITTYTTVENPEKPENGHFQIQVIEGELQITQTIDQEYTKDKNRKANQSFTYKIQVFEPDTTKAKGTFYQSIEFDDTDIAKNNYTKTLTIKGLEKGDYVVTMMDSWSWKYNNTLVTSNYNNLNKLPIGKKTSDTTKPYYGTANKTIVNKHDISNPATIEFSAALSMSNIFGDVGSAMNIFRAGNENQ